MDNKFALETDRLNLRGLSATDRPFVFKLISCQDVRRFLGGPVPPERHEHVFDGYQSASAGDLVWVAELKRGHLPLGLVFLSKHVDSADTELSYQFDSDNWGKGYAFEATRKILSFAKNELCKNRLIAETQSANKASRRLLMRLGMVEQRRLFRHGAEQVLYGT